MPGFLLSQHVSMWKDTVANGRRKVAMNALGISVFFKMECIVLSTITEPHNNGKKAIKLLALNCISALRTDCTSNTYVVLLTQVFVGILFIDSC